MSVSVNPPKTPVTKGSKGVASATMPNVCKMPGPPAPFVLTALRNVGRSGSSPKGYTKHVKVGGQPVAIRGASFKSKGDAASKGTGGGLVSSNTHGPTKFAGPGSRNVKFEGKNVQLLGDPMLNNCNPAGRLPNSATMVGVVQASGVIALVGDEVCALCGKKHGNAAQLQETADTKADADRYTEAAQRAVTKAAAAREQCLAEMQHENQLAFEKYRQEKEFQLRKKLVNDERRGNTVEITKTKEEMEKLKTAEVKEARLKKVELPTMLAVVHCKDGKVFAATSSGQRKEVTEETPANWHTPPHDSAIFPPRDDGKSVRQEKLQRCAPAPEIFAQQWHIAKKRAEDYHRGGINEPHHPPGQCAAPKAVALALEHGGRPVGLTERWYNSNNPKDTVPAMYRDSVEGEPKLGEFGGKMAVPPCGTCELLLTMLLCPEQQGSECQHRTPNKGVCRCT